VVTASNIDWSEVIKKEARGSGDEDLGEVQEVGPNYVLVKKGLINKENSIFQKIRWKAMTATHYDLGFLKKR
jgi:hypothetical protein